MKKIFGIILMFSVINCTTDVDIKLEIPSIISSGMVLQRDATAVIWGKSTPGKKVTITTNWGENEAVRADKKGEWKANIPTGIAGGPHEMVIQSGDSIITLQNILFGEVWLCSGQSNMEMPLCGFPPEDSILNSKYELSNAQYPEIRLFTVAKVLSPEPLDNCQGSWSECGPETASDFSATAFFFGKELYKNLNVPIGLIHSSWGGTPAESWTSKNSLLQLPSYADKVDSLQEEQDNFDSLMTWMGDLDNLMIDRSDDFFYANLDCKENEYALAEYDHSSWPVMPVPSYWEEVALPDFDGVVWFRKEFDVPQSMRNKELILHLGPIDDMDIVYINGIKIDETRQMKLWKLKRDYKVPAGVLNEVENILAVCVLDHNGKGGLYSPEDMKISDQKGNEVVLNGEWNYLPIAQHLGAHIYYFNEEKTFADQPKFSSIFSAHTPTTLFNAMINPLVPFTLRGAIWYQGETNVGRGFEYRTLFPAMIESWRSAWGLGDFPFYFVQIAPYSYSEEELSPAAELREAQLMTMKVPNTGMVVTMDIGDPMNIHPPNKEDVGKRLAYWALAKQYDYDSISYSGPVYDSLSIVEGKAIVHFNYTDGGLIAMGGELTHFEIAGSDKIFHPAKAKIEENTIIVESGEVAEPLAVRYGWSATAEPNLFNGAGLPASPFRTDNWKRLSED